jgi:hypothetical protein
MVLLGNPKAIHILHSVIFLQWSQMIFLCCQNLQTTLLPFTMKSPGN